MLFTSEELEEMRKADALIDAEPITFEEILEAQARDREFGKLAGNKKAEKAEKKRDQSEQRRQYYLNHREESIMYARNYRNANLERCRETNRRYYARHREERLAYNREYQKRKRERQSELKTDTSSGHTPRVEPHPLKKMACGRTTIQQAGIQSTALSISRSIE